MYNRPVVNSVINTGPNEFDSAEKNEKLIVTNESDALNLILKYFSEKMDTQCCQSCFEESNLTNNKELNLNIYNYNHNNYYKKMSTKYSYFTLSNCHEYVRKVDKKYRINTCYFTAVQNQIAEFFRCFDLNFDKKLTYQEFSRGLTSLFLDWDNYTLNGNYLFTYSYFK
jgi:hypothetical protein